MKSIFDTEIDPLELEALHQLLANQNNVDRVVFTAQQSFNVTGMHAKIARLARWLGGNVVYEAKDEAGATLSRETFLDGRKVRRPQQEPAAAAAAGSEARSVEFKLGKDADASMLDVKDYGMLAKEIGGTVLVQQWFNGAPNQLWEETTYVDGVANGPHRTWWQSGHPYDKGTMLDGKPHGLWQEFDEHGRLVKETQH